MSEIPPYTCDPNADVFDRLDIYDSQGNFILGCRSNICTAQWLCDYYESQGDHGPNYPLEWRHYTPPPPPEPPEESPQE